jgi:hypothetical protein
MELDTGATLTSMSLATFRKICPSKTIEPTNIQMRGYFGEVKPALGKVNVHIQHGDVKSNQNLYIFEEDVDTVCGRQWLRELNVNTFKLHTLRTTTADDGKLLEKIFNDYNDLFTDTLGAVPEFQVSLKMKGDVQPIFIKPRTIPYALRDRVENEIDRLEAEGIIERIEYSRWGTPVVPVVKNDDSIRLCADFKVTINQHLLDDKYPIPKIEDIFTKMTGGAYFCTLDVHQAYLHLLMDDESALLQTISTHKGPYKVKRLMFGVKVAPNIYQRFMDQTLQGLEGVACFFDDIVVQGSTLQQSYHRLCSVLDRIRGKNLHLNKTKCQFFKQSVRYLGHEINAQGLHPLQEKVDAITKIQPPKDADQLHTFIGMVNYYHKFIPNVSSILHPLHQLIRKDAQFVWTQNCDAAFRSIKADLASSRVLVHYDPKLQLILAFYHT